MRHAKLICLHFCIFIDQLCILCCFRPIFLVIETDVPFMRMQWHKCLNATKKFKILSKNILVYKCMALRMISNRFLKHNSPIFYNMNHT